MVPTTRRSAPSNETELVLRARALSGRRVGELADALAIALPTEPRRAKGFVGQLVELALGADVDAGERPDFVKLGIELKTLPIGRNGRPAESTFCCSVDLGAAESARWEGSRLRRRLARVLFVPVESAKLGALPDRRFFSPILWSPSEDEKKTLRDDWQLLMGRLGAGLPVSAHLGEALQLRPKARDARVQVRVRGDARRPVAFYLRAGFTSVILDRMRASP